MYARVFAFKCLWLSPRQQQQQQESTGLSSHWPLILTFLRKVILSRVFFVISFGSEQTRKEGKKETAHPICSAPKLEHCSWEMHSFAHLAGHLISAQFLVSFLPIQKTCPFKIKPVSNATDSILLLLAPRNPYSPRSSPPCTESTRSSSRKSSQRPCTVICG